MTAPEDWSWVNWYATRRHLPDHARVIRGRTWALCGKTDLDTTAEHAKHRREHGRKPVDYDSIPKCKFCQRESERVMGILAVFSAAHEAFCRVRLARTDPTPPQQPTRPTMCRRCGCDTPTCREYGCIDQGEPMSEDRLTGYRDTGPETRYSHGIKDTR